ncbi:MAG: MraY family glycosyltransferase [Candidatus Omnitrophica bacterium]|nr:MraY family glycosyltransferase [Candidatus Omnitrophota bacterium]
MLRYLIIFSSALITSILCVFLLARVSLKYKILQAKGIPLAGGLGIGAAFVFSSCLGVYVYGISGAKIFSILGAALLMLFFGIVDDFKELSILQKFLAQSFCAALLISSGVMTDIIYLGFWGNVIVTFFWILGITNAFNLLDIMDGLAAGTALIVSSALLTVAFFNPDLDMQILSLILCAVTFGFLIFNLPPARVYLGNSGSHFLGFMICAIALVLRYASKNNVFALLSPVVILWLPITDTLLLIIFRIMKKKMPFKKSNDHIAFRIKFFASSPTKTILVMFLLCFIFALAGVILVKVTNFVASGIIMAMFLFSVILFWKLIKVDIYE